jgi:hypothetical protein
MLFNPAIQIQSNKTLRWAKDVIISIKLILSAIKKELFCLNRIISVHNLLPLDQNNSMIWDYKK